VRCLIARFAFLFRHIDFHILFIGFAFPTQIFPLPHPTSHLPPPSLSPFSPIYQLEISPVYTTNFPPYFSFDACANTRIMPAHESSTDSGAWSPMPTAFAAPSPSDVDTWPGSMEKQLSHESSALMRMVYQFTAVLVGAYAALGMGRWLL
jgi:hypothetical protein